MHGQPPHIRFSVLFSQTHTHTHAHIYIYIYIYIHVCMCVRVHTHTHTYIYIMLHCRANTFMMYWELRWKNCPWPTYERNIPATPWRDWRIPQETCNDIRFPGWEMYSWFFYCSVWCFLLLHLFSDAITNSNVRETGTTMNELHETCHHKRPCRQLAPCFSVSRYGTKV